MGQEMEASYYDGIYSASEQYAKHFTESVYYPSWMVVLQALKAFSGDEIVDVGCGPGQFAAFCEHYLPDVPYRGYDFSATAIDRARDVAPRGVFSVADLSVGLPFRPTAGQTIVSLEFLEHVAFDLDLIRSLPAGTMFVGTVPNFAWESHLRHFETPQAVLERYGDLFSSLNVQEVLINKFGTRLFVMSGRRAS